MNNNLSEVETYLSFKLDEEVFAINVSKVLNILEMKPITRIPQSPDYLKGVINLRGTVLPVVDLRLKFGLPENKITVNTNIIVLSLDKDEEAIMLGILIDEVREVLEFKNDEIAQTAAIGTRYNAGFISGMWRREENFIMILDIDKVFSNQEVLDIREEVTPAKG